MSDEPTVYLVDDDPATLRALTALVKLVFPCVEAFSSAADFLAAYREHQPGCLVLDVEMPGMNGIELQRKLLQDNGALPVVFVSGCAKRGDSSRSNAVGGSQFSGKTCSRPSTLE